MPDANKLATLQEHKYQVLTTCGVCVHGQFVLGSAWGSCSRIMYQHLKHTGEKPVSVYLAGTCPGATMRLDAKEHLARSGFDIFV